MTRSGTMFPPPSRLWAASGRWAVVLLHRKMTVHRDSSNDMRAVPALGVTTMIASGSHVRS